MERTGSCVGRFLPKGLSLPCKHELKTSWRCIYVSTSTLDFLCFFHEKHLCCSYCTYARPLRDILPMLLVVSAALLFENILA